jgi:hypothetical protein
MKQSEQFRDSLLEKRKNTPFPNIWERSPSPPLAFVRRQQKAEVKVEERSERLRSPNRSDDENDIKVNQKLKEKNRSESSESEEKIKSKRDKKKSHEHKKHHKDRHHEKKHKHKRDESESEVESKKKDKKKKRKRDRSESSDSEKKGKKLRRKKSESPSSEEATSKEKNKTSTNEVSTSRSPENTNLQSGVQPAESLEEDLDYYASNQPVHSTFSTVELRRLAKMGEKPAVKKERTLKEDIYNESEDRPPANNDEEEEDEALPVGPLPGFLFFFNSIFSYNFYF